MRTKPRGHGARDFAWAEYLERRAFAHPTGLAAVDRISRTRNPGYVARCMTTLLITHPACLDHLTPAGHPERPDRLRAIERALEQEKFQDLARVEAPAAELETIALCHPMDYVTTIRDATPKDSLVQLDAD